MEYIPLDINAANFIDSYRNIGYSLQTAIADVIDNSIFASASKVYIDMALADSFWNCPTIKL